MPPFETTRHELRHPRLPATFAGGGTLRIAQVSDFHALASTPESRIRAAFEAVAEERPDLVFLTGDFLSYSRRPLRHFPRLFRGIGAPTFAVLGNHDHWVDPHGVRGVLEGLGHTVLQNQACAVMVRNTRIWIVGVDDATSRRENVGLAFAGVPAGEPTLVLAHTPSTFDRLPEDRETICFSGHTHGGHVYLGRFTERLGRAMGMRYLRGHYRRPNHQLYVNRGLGGGGPVPRVGSKPEVAFFRVAA
jgi:predicted MPP superfamily phosphohydrolase